MLENVNSLIACEKGEEVEKLDPEIFESNELCRPLVKTLKEWIQLPDEIKEEILKRLS